MVYEKNMELRYEFADSRIVSGLHDSSTRRPLCVLVLLRFDIVKHSICIPSFCFYKRYFFCHKSMWPLSKNLWSRVMHKRLFGSFGSIRTNWRSITWLVRQSYCQSYCHCFCRLAVCCIFFYKNIQFSSFLKMLKTGLKWLRVNL